MDKVFRSSERKWISPLPLPPGPPPNDQKVRRRIEETRDLARKEWGLIKPFNKEVAQRGLLDKSIRDVGAGIKMEVKVEKVEEEPQPGPSSRMMALMPVPPVQQEVTVVDLDLVKQDKDHHQEGSARPIRNQEDAMKVLKEEGLSLKFFNVKNQCKPKPVGRRRGRKGNNANAMKKKEEEKNQKKKGKKNKKDKDGDGPPPVCSGSALVKTYYINELSELFPKLKMKSEVEVVKIEEVEEIPQYPWMKGEDGNHEVKIIPSDLEDAEDEENFPFPNTPEGSDEEEDDLWMQGSSSSPNIRDIRIPNRGLIRLGIDLATANAPSLEDWMKKGAKSGPHRLLSGDPRYASHMEKSYKEKTSFEWKYIENLGKEKEILESHRMQAVPDQEKRKELFKKLQELTSVAWLTVKGESFQDKATISGSVMPILIPPIPEAEKLELKNLGYFSTLINPTLPLWRSNNIQQQINENLILVGKKHQEEQRLMDYARGKWGLLDNMNDFIIEMSIFEGRNPDDDLPMDIRTAMEPQLLYKLNLLGTNTIQDLRNAVRCNGDLMATADLESPDDPINPEEILKNRYRAWSLVIRNTVFGEETNALHVLNQWLQSNPQDKLESFVDGNNHTLLRDLTLRVGEPYAFRHLQDCEHIIVFNDIRGVTEHDEYDATKYPLIVNRPFLKTVLCHADKTNVARWEVAMTDKFPETPMILCNGCVRMFCFNNDGTKRFPFRLYPYRQLANEM